MKPLMKRGIFLAFLLILIVQGTGYGKDGFKVDLAEIKKLSLGQMVEKAKGFLSKNNELYSNVLSSAGSAKNSGDLSRLQCLKGVIPAMKVLLRIGEQSMINLKEAAATGERAEAEHQYVKVVISNQKMLELYQQAQQCGEVKIKQIFEKGVKVEKKIVGEIPKEDVVSKVVDVQPPPEGVQDKTIVSLDRFVQVNFGNEIPGTGFY